MLSSLGSLESGDELETPLGSQRLAELAWKAVGDFTGTNAEVSAGGVSFKYVGEGETRVCVLGPDNIVYKVPLWSSWQVPHELDFFRYVGELAFSWAPDFWYYESHRVMAMPLYREYPFPIRRDKSTLLGEGKWWRPEDDVVIDEIRRRCGDIRHANIGVREDETVVLLDGGHGIRTFR